MANICQAADKQLFTLVEWAKRIPHFQELPIEDQVILLRSGNVIQNIASGGPALNILKTLKRIIGIEQISSYTI